MKLDKIYKEVSDELGLDIDDVKNAYNSYWEFFRNCMSALPLKEDLTEEEFSKLRASFNIPSIGKFYCNYDRYRRMKNKLKKTIDVKNKKMYAASQSCDSDS